MNVYGLQCFSYEWWSWWLVGGEERVHEAVVDLGAKIANRSPSSVSQAFDGDVRPQTVNITTSRCGASG